MRIARHADLPVTPWRNGAGVVRSIADGPGWQVRLADIDRSVAFSDYPGHLRHFALADGAVRLRFPSGEAIDCGPGTASAVYPGAPPPYCDLIGPGPALAFNLIVEPDHVTGAIERVSVGAGPVLIGPGDGEVVAVMVQTGRVRLPDAPGAGIAGRLDAIVDLPPSGVRLCADESPATVLVARAGTAVYRLRRGSGPLLVSMPHVGTDLPAALATRMTPQALTLADTDWHLPRVYDFLDACDATILTATQSRLVIDLNRPPSGENLYPGRDTTTLVPVDTFRKEPVYREGLPDDAEIAMRRTRWWQPYHDALAAEIARLRQLHPRVVLWDAHSIASALPRFFAGRLTDLNFGTADGKACDADLAAAILAPVERQTAYSWVLNGRFKGGYITRHYGDPGGGVHAMQLEMSQIVYMDETAPFALREDLCRPLRPLLHACLSAAIDWASTGRRSA